MGKIISLDIETAGENALIPHLSHITCVGLWCPEFSLVIRDLTELKQFVKDNPQFSYVGQNFVFDLKHLYHNGVDLRDKWAHDTRLMAHTSFEKPTQEFLDKYEEQRKIENKKLKRGYSHRKAGPQSLKTLAPYFLNVPAFWENPENHDNDEYVLKDCEYTYKLYELLTQKLLKQGNYKFYNEWLMPRAKMILDAELTGVKLDEHRLKELEVEACDRRESAKTTLDKIWAPAYEEYKQVQKSELLGKYKTLKTLKKKFKEVTGEINFSSPKQLQWLFRDYLGLDITNFSDEESTGIEVLEKLSAEGREDIKAFIEYRKYNKLATSFFPTYKELSNEGIIRPSFNVAGTRTGRLSSSEPNCLSIDTEILTIEGFKTYSKLSKKDLVAGWNAETNKIIFEHPSNIFKLPKKERNFVEVNNQHLSIKVTEDHRCLYQNRKSNKFFTKSAKKSNWKDSKILHGAECSEGIDTLNPDLLRLLIAIQADGNLTADRVDIQVSKERKKHRLKEILDLTKINYTQVKSKKNNLRVAFKLPTSLKKYLDSNKIFTSNLLKLEPALRDIIINEIKLWDGLSTRRSQEYCSKYKKNVDIIQAIYALKGYRGHIYQSTTNGKLYWRLSLTKRNYSLSTNSKLERYSSNEEVWCIKTPSTYFLARRNNKTFITGNCQQVPGDLRQMFIARPNYKLITRDQSYIEPRLVAFYTQDPMLCDLILRGGNFHSANTKIMFELDCAEEDVKDKYPKERGIAKTCGLALMYGAGARRIQMTARKAGIHWELKKCKELYKNFKNTYKTAFKFKENLDKIARRDAIENLFGRQHNYFNSPEDIYMKAFNTLIQSSASDLVIDSAYKCMQVFQEKDINAQVILFVHDELVFEVPEDQVERCEKIIEYVMTSYKLETSRGVLPLEVEGSTGNHWAK